MPDIFEGTSSGAVEFGARRYAFGARGWKGQPVELVKSPTLGVMRMAEKNIIKVEKERLLAILEALLGNFRKGRLTTRDFYRKNVFIWISDAALNGDYEVLNPCLDSLPHDCSRFWQTLLKLNTDRSTMRLSRNLGVMSPMRLTCGKKQDYL